MPIGNSIELSCKMKSHQNQLQELKERKREGKRRPVLVSMEPYS